MWYHMRMVKNTTKKVSKKKSPVKKQSKQTTVWSILRARRKPIGFTIIAILLLVLAWPYLYGAALKLSPYKEESAQALSAPEQQIKSKLPSKATVLTLSGLTCNLTDSVDDQFGGMFKRAPYTRVKVQYPACVNKDSIPQGVSNLDKILKITKGPKIVIGHSQGAQVASRWMREHANDPKAPSASELTFILTGNPLRSTGNGYIIGRKEVGGTVGVATPTNTKWTIIDVARRYDGWADWVKDTNNKWAVKNAEAGKKYFHSNYDKVNLFDPYSTVWTKGNTTYVLTKEFELPMWHNDTWYRPNYVVTAMQAAVEKGHGRPSGDPKVVVQKTPRWDLYWRWIMSSWKIDYKL